MSKVLIIIITVVAYNLHAQKNKQTLTLAYFPGSEWEHKTPESMGMNMLCVPVMPLVCLLAGFGINEITIAIRDIRKKKLHEPVV